MNTAAPALRIYRSTDFKYEENRQPVVMVFESVQAVLKDEFGLLIKKEINSGNRKFLSYLKSYATPLEVLERPNGKICFRGTLNAIIKCQEVVSSLQKSAAYHQRRNRPRSRSTELKNKGLSSKTESTVESKENLYSETSPDKLNCKLSRSDRNTVSNTSTILGCKVPELVTGQNSDEREITENSSKIEKLPIRGYNTSNKPEKCASTDNIKSTSSDIKSASSDKESISSDIKCASSDNIKCSTSDVIKYSSYDIKCSSSDGIKVTHSYIDIDSSKCQKDVNGDSLKVSTESDSVRKSGKNSAFSCSVCSFECLRESQYTKHLSFHREGGKTYECNFCEFRTVRRVLFSRHLSTHEEKNGNSETDSMSKVENTQFRCELCGFNARLQREYKLHLEKVHPITYSCPQCAYKTTKKVHYIRHVRNVHENLRPYACDYCGLAFKRRDALKQHLVIHYKSSDSVSEANPKAPFRCKVCDKIVRSAAYLREHMLTHSEQRSFLCEMCGASFKTRSVHRNHLRVVHSQEVKSVCKLCGKIFATKFSLSRHMRQHGHSHLPSSGKKESQKSGNNKNKKCSDICASQLLHSDLLSGPSLQIPEKRKITPISNTDCITTTIESVCSERFVPSAYTETTSLSSANFGICIDSQIPYVIQATEYVNA